MAWAVRCYRYYSGHPGALGAVVRRIGMNISGPPLTTANIVTERAVTVTVGLPRAENRWTGRGGGHDRRTCRENESGENISGAFAVLTHREAARPAILRQQRVRGTVSRTSGTIDDAAFSLMMRPCDGNGGVFLRAGFTPAGGLRLWIRRRRRLWALRLWSRGRRGRALRLWIGGRRGRALRLWVAGATAGRTCMRGDGGRPDRVRVDRGEGREQVG
ncbi:MAG: hypothetical protein ACYCVB_10140 [Bacilli bacterium]